MMRSPIHSEAWPFFALFSLASILMSRICRWASLLAASLAGFTLFFFRDPEREIPQGQGLIVSPADGVVVGVDTVEHAPFLEGPAKRISIFLSVFNVHINRAPIEGKVTLRHYHPGKFLPANCDKASTDNEQNSIGIQDGEFRILVKQIAGIIARRIVCWKDAGEFVGRGERFGLIRFGSRTELYLPVGSQIDVVVGQKVNGGSTVVARRN